MSNSFVSSLLRRDDNNNSSSDGLIVKLLTALVVIFGLGLFLGGALIFIRRYKKKNAPVLPTHARTHSLTINAIPYTDNKRTSFFGFSASEKKELSQPGTPTSPVPEIRITFPEEEGVDGKRKSGRVVIVQVGEAGAAFVRDVEPEDDLPPYQRKGEFSSIDLEKVGGLREKEFS